MRFVARWVFAVAMVIAGTSLTSSAWAQEDREAARAEFERGRSSFEAGAYREALDHFQEAYRLAPHPNVRVNIANCYDQLDRPIEALFHFEHFLTEADHPPAAQRREVETAMARLRTRVGAITLQITPDGAQITIDSTETRRAPVPEPVRVTAGSHVVEIQLDGYRPERQTVVVEGGGTARLALRLQRAEPAVASTGTGTG
ncbi:MAG: tetratricopeptide repeat protein, partial [Deltaproteobacteria bacterium]|nr:tetratricopeptide repeat protein [Deltaproteobacteria bacterium]